MREQQAELCAWMVLKTYGLYYKTNEVYLKNWGLNENTIVEIFDNMSNTASYIIEKINQKTFTYCFFSCCSHSLSCNNNFCCK